MAACGNRQQNSVWNKPGELGRRSKRLLIQGSAQNMQVHVRGAAMWNVEQLFINATKRNVVFVLLLVFALQFRASAQGQNPALLESNKTIKLNPLPLNHVRLTGGPLKVAQEADAKYLLELQPDRMLAFLRQHAGLKPKAEGYGGWDGP